MSEEALLKKALKEANCYLEAMLTKYEFLRTESQNDFELFAKKWSSLNNLLSASRHSCQLLQKENDILKKEKTTLLEEHAELEQRQALMKEQLLQQKLSLAKTTRQLGDLQEKLSVAEIQAELYRNDFNLERESRERLNDEKLKLEEALEAAMREAHPLDRVKREQVEVADGRAQYRPFGDHWNDLERL